MAIFTKRALSLQSKENDPSNLCVCCWEICSPPLTLRMYRPVHHSTPPSELSGHPVCGGEETFTPSGYS